MRIHRRARAVGVRTPSVLFCNARGPGSLPTVWPSSWGCCFAIKPLYGYMDWGIMLVEFATAEELTGNVDEGKGRYA